MASPLYRFVHGSRSRGRSAMAAEMAARTALPVARALGELSAAAAGLHMPPRAAVSWAALTSRCVVGACPRKGVGLATSKLRGAGNDCQELAGTAADGPLRVCTKLVHLRGVGGGRLGGHCAVRPAPSLEGGCGPQEVRHRHLWSWNFHS